MISAVGALPLVAYRIATEPNFLDHLRHQSDNRLSGLQTLDLDEQSALQKLLKQGLAYLLLASPDDAPLEGYWWTTAGK